MGAPRIDRLEENLLINPTFRFRQRMATDSQSGVTVQQILLDRWLIAMSNIGSSSLFVERSSSKPLPYLDAYSHRIRMDNVTGMTADGFMVVGQRVEGNRFARVQGKWAYLRFWTYSNKIGTFSLALGGQTLSSVNYITTYERTVASGWEQHFVPIQFTGSGIGLWNYTNDVGLQIFWSLRAGANVLTSTLDQWKPGGGTFAQSATQLDTVNDEFRLFLPEFIGPFETEPVAPDHSEPAHRVRAEDEELRLCQRYYYRVDDPNVVTGTVGNGRNVSTAIARIDFHFPVEMRATPIHDVSTNTDFTLYSATGQSVNQVSGFTPTESNAKRVMAAVNSAIADLNAGGANTMRKASASGRLAFNAEI